MATDARLVALVRSGNAAAFEAIYDRYHRPILSFCRHMLGDPEEAADAVQHTFMAAYNTIVSSEKTILLRAWLFTIARNRCYSVLRARREQPAGELVEPSTEGLAAQVQRREDLRELLGDLRRLPDNQRAALVLAELGMLSHGEIAAALDIPAAKVKALVFQARESLIASRTARDTDCTEIRRQLSTLSGAALRRGNLRRHLRECQGCREYRTSTELQRRGLAAILPVVPPLALKDAVLEAVSGTGGTVGAVGAGGLFASAAFKSLALKGLLYAVLALAGTAGTLAVVHDWHARKHAGLARASSAIASPAVGGVRVDTTRTVSHHGARRVVAPHRHVVRSPAAEAVKATAVAHPGAVVSAVAAERAAARRAVHRRARPVHRSAAPVQQSAAVQSSPQPAPTVPAASAGTDGSGSGGSQPSDQGDGDSQGQDQGQGPNGNGGGDGHHHGGDGQQQGS